MSTVYYICLNKKNKGFKACDTVNDLILGQTDEQTGWKLYNPFVYRWYRKSENSYI